MPRIIPGAISAPQWQPPAGREQTLSLDIEVITPLFGGGYEPGECDPLQLIRPASIRGQLRFWWRATRGAGFTSAEELFQEESRIWGAATRKGASFGESPVRLRVRLLSPGCEQRCGRYEPGKDGRLKSVPTVQRGWPPYALQPFLGELDEGRMTVAREPSIARLGVRFSLEIQCPGDFQEDVWKSVAAWVRFGGIGARTRRGCGSLKFSKPESLPADWGPDPAGEVAQFPGLRGAVQVMGPPKQTAVEAWGHSVEAYEAFRRQTESGKPIGKSLWPEADAIRRVTKRVARSDRMGNLPDCYPRADLGLPIVFHFKDGGDPPDTTLGRATDGQSRMASPVVTRAWVDGRRYRPMVLVLNAPHVFQSARLVLQWKGPSVGGSIEVTQAQVELDQADRGRVPPLRNQDVRSALLTFLEERWQASRTTL
jgi:CRISPR-associated protein Cmr1